MEAITITLIIIAAIIASSWIVRMIPIPVPLPIIQIALGYIIAAVGRTHMELDPHVFMFLFLPPLLFLDGWRIPKEGLTKDLDLITLLAFGLVFITVAGVGYLIHWMIPNIELPIAFGLAAVISPTDPVAVSAIASKIPFPKRMIHVLEGESLFNDASGLVCLKFALIAAATLALASESEQVVKVFSLSAASIDFITMVVGGLAVGFVLTASIGWLKFQISRRWGEDSGSQILISLLIPFLAYTLAEHFHFSGVIAAVSAGIAMSYSEIRSQIMAVTRIRRNAFWDALQLLANGAMFVLLGEQLPQMVRKIPSTIQQSGHESAWWLLIYVIIITMALMVTRWIWIWVVMKFRGRIFDALKILKDESEAIAKGADSENNTSFATDGPEPMHAAELKMSHAYSFKNIFSLLKIGITQFIPFCQSYTKTSFHPVDHVFVSIMTFAGVRGSITLAAVLTFPLSIVERDLVIFLASGVILVTLIMASFILPILMKKLKMPLFSNDKQDKKDRARNRAAEEAIKAIEKEQHELATKDQKQFLDLYVDVANQIMSTYRSHIEMRNYGMTGAEADINAPTVRKAEEIEHKLRLAALSAERDSIYLQARKKLISEEIRDQLVREIDLTEASISER